MRLSSRSLLLALVLAAVVGAVTAWALVGSSAAPASAQPTVAASAGGITVNGEGSVSAVPDRAQWSFGVSTSGRDATQTWNAAAQKAQALEKALKSAGVASKDIQTSGISLSPNYTATSPSRINGYTASMSVTVTVPIKDASHVVSAAVSAGANDVNGPSLSLADSESYYQQALALAIDQAHARAQAAAKAAGVTLGKPTAIDTTGNGPIVFQAAAAPAAGKAADVPIAPGQQQITADVTVTYAIVG